MATQSPALSPFLPEFTGSLLAEREIHPRARIVAQQVAEVLPGCAVAVYLLEGAPQTWNNKAAIGEITVTDFAVAPNAGLFGQLARGREAFVTGGATLRREQYGHLNARRTVRSLAYYPLLLDDVLLAAIEIVSFDRPLAVSDLAALEPLSDFAALALASAATYENERNAQFKTITRLTQLYDLERVFNSTLQMDRLLSIITSKIEEIL